MSTCHCEIRVCHWLVCVYLGGCIYNQSVEKWSECKDDHWRLTGDRGGHW